MMMMMMMMMMRRLRLQIVTDKKSCISQYFVQDYTLFKYFETLAQVLFIIELISEIKLYYE